MKKIIIITIIFLNNSILGLNIKEDPVNFDYLLNNLIDDINFENLNKGLFYLFKLAKFYHFKDDIFIFSDLFINFKNLSTKELFQRIFPITLSDIENLQDFSFFDKFCQDNIITTTTTTKKEINVIPPDLIPKLFKIFIKIIKLKENYTENDNKELSNFLKKRGIKRFNRFNNKKIHPKI